MAKAQVTNLEKWQAAIAAAPVKPAENTVELTLEPGAPKEISLSNPHAFCVTVKEPEGAAVLIEVAGEWFGDAAEKRPFVWEGSRFVNIIRLTATSAKTKVEVK